MSNIVFFNHITDTNTNNHENKPIKVLISEDGYRSAELYQISAGYLIKIINDNNGALCYKYTCNSIVEAIYKMKKYLDYYK